jgi:peptide deformylase
MWDDCMSFPGLLVRLRRHGSVSLRFFDAEGQPQTMNRLDLPSAELFQHEIDHLEGILAVDRADEIRDLVSREAFEQFRLAFEGRVDYTGRG